MIALRPIRDADLPIFFEHQRDPVACHMAAFTHADPDDRAAFDAHWARIRSTPGVVNRTIVEAADAEAVLGHVGAWQDEGCWEVTYWIDRAHWGRGIASAALALLLRELDTRPVLARAASDNLASIRVLERCGFVATGTDRGHANARAAEIEETLFRLDRADVETPR
jgi:RimJ/RimL family protein N-acetyltransferase